MNSEVEKSTKREMNNKQIKIDILLKEYSESQNSAQFHDNLLWVVTSIMLTGNLAMIGFMADNLLKVPKIVISSIAVFSIVLIFCLIMFVHEFRKIKLSKYDRCKKIEKQIRELVKDNEIMLQHSLTPKTKQRFFYYFLLGVIMVFWLIVLWYSTSFI